MFICALFLVGCKGDTEFGQSFNTIIGQSGDSFILDGYASIVVSGSGVESGGTFSQGAVLVVGIKKGVELEDHTFAYGSIVLVEGTEESLAFRLAKPKDNIQLTQSLTVFGTNYNEGRFTVPSGGILTPPE